MSGIPRPLLLVLLLSGLLPHTLPAHEIRPAYLQIRERRDESVQIRWKQPVRGEFTLAISPALSSGWLDGPPGQRSLARDALIKEWIIAPPRLPLPGQTIEIRGLDRTITDVLVTISYRDGRQSDHVIKAAWPYLEITDGRQGQPLNEYFTLGVLHIWSGIDHLAYVFCLILLISGIGTLIRTITAFTVAHSVTLACAVLGLVRLQPAAVEAVIALSIVYVAVELVHVERDRSGFARRFPWAVAFIFGLLHGFGFAGALQSIGLPRANIPGALFLFNIGIEAGQILFVLLVLGLLALLRSMSPLLQRQVLKLAPWCAGSVASYWLLARVWLMV